MGTVWLAWEQVPLTITTGLNLQRCHGTLVYIWFPLRLCLATSRPHIWSSGCYWRSPSISSWLLSLPGEMKRERERVSESGSRPRNEHITASFPPCSALVWSDSSPARPKGELLPALHRTLCLFLIPQPINCIGKLYFCKVSGIVGNYSKHFQLICLTH